MSLLWYYRPEHLQGGRSPSMHEVSCPADGWEKGGQKGEVVGPSHGMRSATLGSQVLNLPL